MQRCEQVGLNCWQNSYAERTLADLERYRAAGGTNAVLANVAIDLADRTESAELKQVSQVTLICAPEEARRRLRRLQQLGFDEVLLVSHTGVLDDLKRARDLI
jgi:tryptophan synthase alpha subunit